MLAQRGSNLREKLEIGNGDLPENGEQIRGPEVLAGNVRGSLLLSRAESVMEKFYIFSMQANCGSLNLEFSLLFIFCFVYLNFQ